MIFIVGLISFVVCYAVAWGSGWPTSGVGFSTYVLAMMAFQYCVLIYDELRKKD